MITGVTVVVGNAEMCAFTILCVFNLGFSSLHICRHLDIAMVKREMLSGLARLLPLIVHKGSSGASSVSTMFLVEWG